MRKMLATSVLALTVFGATGCYGYAGRSAYAPNYYYSGRAQATVVQPSSAARKART